jgi:hypothetical protein
MKSIKVHTSNIEQLINLIRDTPVPGEFWDYNLSYSIDPPRKFRNLKNEHYFNMPEFNWHYEYMLSRTRIKVHVFNEKEKDFLFSLLGGTKKLNYIHYNLNRHPLHDHQYSYTHKIYPKYPLYVVTKGRWNSPLTARALEKMGVDFHLCVEPSEYKDYARSTDKNKILKLPEDFSKRGQGSIPVRNFVWEHATTNGFKKHWVIDDNITGFYRWNLNLHKEVKDGVFFKVLEDFSDRYQNLGLTGCQYDSFIPAKYTSKPQFHLNTRTYSCILINNELLDSKLDDRWRGTYHEDTDLSLRVLSTGDVCTVNFNNFNIGKAPTGTVRGGNTDSIYYGGTSEGYMKKYNELQREWGEIVKITRDRHLDNRPHHIIHYTKLFKQPLILKEGIQKEPKINEYNMILTPPNSLPG